MSHWKTGGRGRETETEIQRDRGKETPRDREIEKQRQRIVERLVMKKGFSWRGRRLERAIRMTMTKIHYINYKTVKNKK